MRPPAAAFGCASLRPPLLMLIIGLMLMVAAPPRCALAQQQQGILDPCSAHPTECEEPHPAAVCALPVCDADDDAALMALPNADRFLGRLSFPFCADCACLAAHDLCDELRPGIPNLDTVCGCSCAPPRAVAERRCAAASLPTPAWSTDGLSHDTPALEYPSVAEACRAGDADAMVRRTERWLDLAHDYDLQGATGNAGVIAQQVCLERRFGTLACLGGGGGSGGAEPCVDDPSWTAAAPCAGPCSCETYVAEIRGSNHQYCATDRDGGGRLAADACPASCGSCTAPSNDSPGVLLADLHDQACALAVGIGMGQGLEEQLGSNNVPPLRFRQYREMFASFESFIRSQLESLEALGEDSEDLQR
eukprot:SAG31_NODE_6385_length_2036_cov_1.672173_1_plen_362_part_01